MKAPIRSLSAILWEVLVKLTHVLIRHGLSYVIWPYLSSCWGSHWAVNSIDGSSLIDCRVVVAALTSYWPIFEPFIDTSSIAPLSEIPKQNMTQLCRQPAKTLPSRVCLCQTVSRTSTWRVAMLSRFWLYLILICILKRREKREVTKQLAKWKD